jgi:SAM-dependent methyltransferase
MPEEMLVETLAKVRRHPWHHARKRLIIRLLRTLGKLPPAAVMEVGCGWGLNLGALESLGYRVTGMDISRRVLQEIDQPQRRLIEADLYQPFPAEVEKHDVVLALDVIEHLDDDQSAVRQMGRLLRPDGVAVISVPALPELFSDFDAIQGHRRRYVPETLRLAVEGGGLEVVDIFWWGAWMVPILRRSRTKKPEPGARPKTYSDYLTLPPWPAPLVLSLAYALEEPAALKKRLRTGTSLFAVARQGK